MQIVISDAEQRFRLDKCLSNHLPEYSRSQLQKLIKEGLVLLNDQPAKTGSSLNSGDKINIISLDILKEPRPTTSPIFEQIVIVDEQADYLVVNKPAGLIVHEAASLQEACLVDWLLERYPEIKTVGEDSLRPGIVHRLDKDVSGLLIVAKTQKGFLHFKKLFQGRRLKKIYTALVHGAVKADDDSIDFPIERSNAGYKMAARPKNQEGKPAQTEFKTIKRFLHYSLLEVLIKTGRTHQIRAHLAAYGHPIIGDNLYGHHTAKLANHKLGSKRIYLYASRLEFKDPSGEKKEYALSAPDEFSRMISILK
jgi:23S rRNA pseudouridine1911/1915/1917 synthase